MKTHALKSWAFALVGGAGLLLIALGILQGGYLDTLRKAVLICLECIGIG